MRVIRAMEMKSRRGDEARRGDDDCREDEEHFEGNVWLQAMFPPLQPSKFRVNLVIFEPGARTNWHKHPEFQILYVVAGKGRVESSDESGNRQGFEIAAGDIVHLGRHALPIPQYWECGAGIHYRHHACLIG